MARYPVEPDVFRAVADPSRRQILDKLRIRAMPVHELSEGLEMTAPAVSQHLKLLREVGLIAEERQGRNRVYTLTPEPLKELVDWASHYQQFWPARLAALGDHLKKKKGAKTC
jgi:DNA-binding transcriptional ArsR family regulator